MPIDETKPIAVTGKLRNWRVFKNYEGNLIATGDSYGDVHGRFGDGENIYTSPIVEGPTPKGYIRTENSVYYLEGEGKDER